MGLAKIQHTTTLKTLECGSCGVVHAIPESLYDAYYEEGGYWHCPMGHRRGWPEGESQREKKSLKKKLENANKLLEWAKFDATQERKKAINYKGQITKLKNRAKFGVCPCCNRTFKQLAAHMKNKHPKYNTDKG